LSKAVLGVLVAVGCGLVLAACGGGDSGDSGGSGTAPLGIGIGAMGGCPKTFKEYQREVGRVESGKASEVMKRAMETRCATEREMRQRMEQICEKSLDALKGQLEKAQSRRTEGFRRFYERECGHKISP
jgi:hypothetical protein